VVRFRLVADRSLLVVTPTCWGTVEASAWRAEALGRGGGAAGAGADIPDKVASEAERIARDCGFRHLPGWKPSEIESRKFEIGEAVAQPNTSV